MSFWDKEKSLAQSEPYELHKFWIGEETTTIEESNQVIRFVDPDAPGPIHDGLSWETAYLSLQAWDEGEATNLVTAEKYHTVYCRSSNGTADTTYFTLQSPWVTSSDYYIEIIGFDFPTDGIWDDTKYRLEITGYACIRALVSNIFVRNMQLHCKETFDGELEGFFVDYNYNVDAEIDSCLIRCSGGWGGNVNIGVYNRGIGTVKVYNCVLLNWGPYRSPAVGGSWGMRMNNASGALYAYNCTIWNDTGVTCNGGLINSAGTMVAKNCIVSCKNSGYDFTGTITISNCCSDDGDGTNPQTPSDGDWDNEFIDKDNLNFNLLSGGNCVGNGLYDPSSGLYDTDIGGNPRSGNWDIGSSEYTPYEQPALPIYWLYADAPRDVVYDSQLYTACYITGEKIEEGTSRIKSRTKIKTNWNNPFAWQYTTNIPYGIVHYKRFRGQGSDVKLIYVGDVLSVEFKQTSRQGERYALITIEPPKAQLGEMGLVSRYSRQCTVELYSTQCGVNSVSYVKNGNLDSISGNVLTSITFGTESDGYWNGGYIMIKGFYAKVIDHSGNDITILPYIYNLTVGDGFYIYPGCDHLSTTCDTKFSNLNDYKGQPDIPYDSPFSEEAMFA